VVGVSARLSVGHVREPCKNGGTDGDAVGNLKPCIRWNQDPPTGGGSFRGLSGYEGLSGPFKSTVKHRILQV